MCNPTAVIGLMAVSGVTQAYGSYQSGVAANQVAQTQAAQARAEGATALARGQKQSELVQAAASYESKNLAIKKAETLASQRAAMAAMGMDPGSVTAQDIVSSSLTKANMDELALRYNANVKSWAIGDEARYANWIAQNEASMFSLAGKNAKRAGLMNATGTLLGTAASIGMSGLLAKAPTTTSQFSGTGQMGSSMNRSRGVFFTSL